MGQAASGWAKNKTGRMLDELFMGNFKDAVVDILGKKIESDDDARKMFDALKNNDDYKKAKERRQSRKSSGAEIGEPQDMKFNVMWYDGGDESVGKRLGEIVRQIQAAGKKLEDDMTELKKKLKAAGVKLTDEQIADYAPALFKLVNDGATDKELKNAVKSLGKTLNESMQARRRFIDQNARLARGFLMLEAACGNDFLMEALAERLVKEGFFGDVMSKIKNSKTVQGIKGVAKKMSSKLADASKKGLQKFSKYSIGPILSLAGVGVGILTGGALAELAIKAMDIVERNGKGLRDSFNRAMSKYANSKGVITRMDFKSEDGKNGYSLRFYMKDMVWRLINLEDQLKAPSKEQVKGVVDGESGRKYRDRLAKIWDPLFQDSGSGKIDFQTLLGQAKDAGISEKALKLFGDFRDAYGQIKSDCIESPKIDTRAQKLK